MNPQQWHGDTPGFSLAATFPKNDTVDERKNDFFELKPYSLTDSYSGLPPVAPMNSPGTYNRRSEPHDQVQSQVPSQQNGSENSIRPEMISSTSSRPAGVDSEYMNQEKASTTGLQASQSDRKDIGHPVIAKKSSDDGYNWRKYGQKLVKGCEFPRCYYKCTHSNCEVKKIFERSLEGKITKIVYKGTHDHPKPQSARRFPSGAITSIREQTEHVSTLASGEDKSAMYGLGCYMDPNWTPRQSCGTNDNCPTQLNGINDEGDEDDPFSKRRKLDEISNDVIPVLKPIREPRVVVQTVSEVDILDDGYKWRKYGQKVVRGNPNPRSYYKCRNVGCPVRKHVERASQDLKAVITTYEGKHNHDVPTAKNSSHDMARPVLGPGAGTVNIDQNYQMSSEGKNRNDPISLDLEVGTNSATENRPNESQQLHPGPMQFHINRAESTFYGVVNGGSYIS